MKSSTHPRRKSPRLPTFDYSSNGAYFVTTCVQNREPLLSHLEQETVKHSALGMIVKTACFDLPNHYPHVELDAFIIMPDHIHGIIWLHDMPIVGDGVGDGLRPSPTRHGLTEIVRALKSFSARRINESRGMQGQAFWQRGFYYHIVRVENDLEQIRQYILENPKRAFLKGVA
jgi:putative transposase